MTIDQEPACVNEEWQSELSLTRPNARGIFKKRRILPEIELQMLDQVRKVRKSA